MTQLKSRAIFGAVLMACLTLSPSHATSEPLQWTRSISAPLGSEQFGGRMVRHGKTALLSMTYADNAFDKHVRPLLIDLERDAAPRNLHGEEMMRSLRFSRGLDLDETRALVCGDAKVTGEDSPRARLFDIESGDLITSFAHSDPLAGRYDRFGWSCKLAGDMVFVSAADLEGKHADAKGAAYIYDAATGQQLRRFAPSAPEAKSRFGIDMAINDRYIAISSTGMSLKRGYFGYVDLFDRTTGEMLNRFYRPDNGVSYNSGRFGTSLTMDETRLIVGGTYDTLKSKRETGTVWVFDLDSFDLERRIVPPEGKEYRNSWFAARMSLWNGRLLVGAADMRPLGANGKRQADAGMAFLFDVESGALLQEFRSVRPEAGAQFGRAVSLTEEGAVISESAARIDDNRRGALHLYRFDNGT